MKNKREIQLALLSKEKYYNIHEHNPSSELPLSFFSRLPFKNFSRYFELSSITDNGKGYAEYFRVEIKSSNFENTVCIGSVTYTHRCIYIILFIFNGGKTYRMHDVYLPRITELRRYLSVPYCSQRTRKQDGDTRMKKKKQGSTRTVSSSG